MYLKLGEHGVTFPRVLWEEFFIESVSNGSVRRRSTVFGFVRKLV